MRKYYLLILAIIFAMNYNSAYSQYVDYDNFEVLEVGESPIYSFHWGTNTNVFCKGIDINGNGEYDVADGDSYPTWWTVGRSGGNFVTNRMKQFEFASLNDEFKPAIDYQNRIIYIPFKDRVASYDLLTTNLIEDNIYEGTIEAVRSAGPHLLIIDKGEINDATGDYENCKLVVYNIENEIALQEIPLLDNASDVIYYQTEEQEIAIAILSDGTMMNPNQQLQYGILPHQQMPDLETMEFDEMVSGFVQYNNAVYVSFNGNPTILKIQPDGELIELTNGMKIDNEYELGSSGMFKVDDKLFIISELGDIRILDNTDAIDFISEQYSDVFEPNKMNFWNNQDYIVLFDSNEESNEIHIGEPVEIEDLNFKYVNVGSQPSKIVYSRSNDTYNIFCLGVDENFNGEFDEGDELPSWWTVKGSGNIALTNKVMEFEMGDLKFPTRLAYDEEIDVVYIPHKDRIASYDILEHTVIEESVYEVDAVSVDLAGPHLMFSVRNDETDQVHVYDRENNNILQSIDAGSNVSKAAYFNHEGGLGLAILNEGNFGQNNSTLMYGNLPHMQSPELKTVEIGDTGNDIAHLNGYIVAVSNGSHHVTNINFETDEVEFLPTGTSGLNGPRNLAVEYSNGNGVLLVSTYKGDIRVMSNYGLNSILKLKNKVEDLYIDIEREFLMATIINNDDYSASKEIAYSGNLVLSAENETEKEVEIVVYPNPTTDFIYVRQAIPLQSNIEIYNMTGARIYNADFYGAITKVDIAELNLSNGTYIVKIANQEGIKTSKFNVVK